MPGQEFLDERTERGVPQEAEQVIKSEVPLSDQSANVLPPAAHFGAGSTVEVEVMTQSVVHERGEAQHMGSMPMAGQQQQPMGGTMGGSAPESTGMGGAPRGMEGSTGRTERSSGLTSETTGRTGGTGMTGPAGTTGGTGTANRIVSEAQSELKSTLPTTDQPQTAAPLLQANVEGGTTTQADVIMQPIVHERGEAETLGYVPVTEPARSPEEAVEKLAGQIKETLNVRETGAPVLPKGPEIHGGKAAEVDVMMQPVVHKRGEVQHLGQVQQEALGTTGTAESTQGLGTRRRSPSPPKYGTMGTTEGFGTTGTTEGLGTRRRSPSPPLPYGHLTGRRSPSPPHGTTMTSGQHHLGSTAPPSSQPISSSPAVGREHERHQEKEGVLDKIKGLLSKDKVKGGNDEGDRTTPAGHTGTTVPSGHTGTTGEFTGTRV